MRAMVFDHYGDPDVMSLTEVPIPEPQDNEVLIRVGYAGVNPADSKQRAGLIARAGYLDFVLPYVPGMDAAGIVERTGANVTEFNAGDRVIACCPPDGKTWGRLVRTAMIENYDLRTATARINAARANLGLARSDQFPQVEASADVTTTRDSKNGQLVAFGQGGRTRSFGSFFLNLFTFELDIWGRLRQQTKAARAELRASEEDRKAMMTIVVSDVAAGYFNLIELDSELEIDKRTLATREESLRIIKLKQQGGLATLLDVRQAEELVYQASQTIPDTERAIEQTENLIS